MKRKVVYPGSVPLETDILDTNRNTMVAMGMLVQTVLGTGVVVDGLACTPGTGLTVQIGRGQIYSLTTVDPTGYSSLAADSTPLVKQGLLLTPAVLNCPAPGTVGQSINYLVEAQFQEVDNTPVALPYYNASNPTIPWSGPAGSGTAQNTVRDDICAVQVKAGVAAATGSQVTPTVDAGWTALYVVTVAYGASSIVGGNIALASGAPFLAIKLPQIVPPVATLFRFPVPVLTGYGAAPAAAVQIADTPVAQFSKALAQSIYWAMPVLDTLDTTKPLKLRIHYTGDVASNNYFLQLGYQIMAAGAITPAAYTNVTEALAPPVGVSALKNYLTTTLVVPANALAAQNWVNFVLTRLVGNAGDTNTGSLQIINITMEQ